ncbi:MAG: ferredoxin [Candidatus Caldatribacteriota bacterium]|nr:ferredoxin [Atribacterota bacterium]MDD3641197.1 ferredoxin [Atribacterota bacterium]MDD4288229.1 ferredoxin [Atribacterota bacterium]MDD4765515.1 ferredoxin [Atribacterota bacterium]MDD5636134.1 ferredoxin [Atribacterota bacterium]
MKATVDKDLCTGCGLCESTCPEVFELQDDVAVVKVDTVPADAEESCKQAAEDCPVEAITCE